LSLISTIAQLMIDLTGACPAMARAGLAMTAAPV
jgi:hypothetical protein